MTYFLAINTSPMSEVTNSELKGHIAGTPSQKEFKVRPINEYLMSSSTVTFSAGIDQTLKSWVLNEDLLCDHSPYFRAAFKGSFKEGKTKTHHFEELDPSGFPHLIDWMYTGKIACHEIHECGNCEGEGECEDHRNIHGISLYSLYVLADFLSMPELAAEALCTIGICLGVSGWLPNAPSIRYTYENTDEESPLRELLVNEFVKAFVLGGDADFKESNAANWTDLVSCDKNFHSDVMIEVKQHTEMEYCCFPKCSIHIGRNGVRERRLERERRARRKGRRTQFRRSLSL